MAMKDLVGDLAARCTRAYRMGGDDAVARQHAAGKLTVHRGRCGAHPTSSIRARPGRC